MIIDQYMSYVPMQYSSAIYFSKAKLERQIEKFGNEKMTVEKKKMASVNKDIEEKCQVKYLPKDELPKEKQLYGDGTFGYEILGIEKYPQCKWMAIDENKFIDFLRNLQNQKARSIGFNFNLFENLPF